MKKNIYFFQWVSDLGGADTRLKELIQLLSITGKYNLFSIPNDDSRLSELDNLNFLKKHGVNVLSWKDLPDKDHNSIAISFCNFRLFSEKWRIAKIKSMGLKFIWSNDMMWSTKDESEAIKNKYIDLTIFTSEFHKYILQKNYKHFLEVKNLIVPNYFHFENYKRLKKKDSLRNKFVVGKLSRADIMKFSEDFPLFYDKMPISNPKFRVMGWNKILKDKFNWFQFDNEKWDLLEENQESIIEFLSQLNLYVFNAHHEYIENQTRSLIEAQLLGVPAIAPNYGNFPNMIWHGKNGFLYGNNEECYHYVNLVSKMPDLYQELSYNSLNLSKFIWTNKDYHLNVWDNIFNNL